MVPTIIISVLLGAIVGLIIYRMIRNAKSGSGGCAGCSYAGTCAAAKILPKKPKRECPEQQEPVHQ
ncbi:MAG TPA: FeoB-associated Cys-rich membrane protein [Anaerolineaceae bacterium]|nr:FeoB-associated Cys-rich membrane protein [Anaerolineaceae bacterium]